MKGYGEGKKKQDECFDRKRGRIFCRGGAFAARCCRGPHNGRDQVKTTQYEKASWLLSSKDETPKADFYVFVRLNGESLPDYYIMQAEEVAVTIRESHAKWLATPKKDGTPHTPISMREIQIKYHDENAYNRWELITGEEDDGKE